MTDSLRDGRSIRTVSALLLQLVQTSAHDVRLEASRITKKRQQIVNLRHQESFNDQDSTSEPFLDELDDRVGFDHSFLESILILDRIFVCILLVWSVRHESCKDDCPLPYSKVYQFKAVDIPLNNARQIRQRKADEEFK